MKRISLLLLLILTSVVAFAGSPVPFDEFFENRTMRVDYFHTGDARDQTFSPDRIYRLGVWAGNPKNLIDGFGYGHYFVKVYDTTSTTLLYSRGFDTYFDEYKTTEQAANGLKRTFHETVLIPYPRNPVLFVLEERDRQNVFHTIYTQKIDPSDYHIVNEQSDSRDSVFVVQHTGDVHDRLDIVIVAEGYTAKEAGTFKADLEKFKAVLLGLEPYASYKNKINITGVFRPSAESGTDQPRQGSYKNTVVSSSFNALDTDRYLLVEDDKTLRDIASAVPYDALCVMVNTTRYGGGGVYNDYTIFTSANSYSETVFLHEFGHGFAGLGDEYYAGDVSYVDFYPRGVEPVEPNLTALLAPAGVKWKSLVTPGIDVPTPWGKAEYDSLQVAYPAVSHALQSALAEVRQRKGTKAEEDTLREQYAVKLRTMRQRVSAILTNPKLQGKVGAFEGAGYTRNGLYRPSVNCMMFSNEEKKFCRVCSEAVANMIRHFAPAP